MLINLFEKLIDRSIQLLREKERQRRILFDQFVTPVLECFEDVHNDYMDSLKDYRNLLKNENEAFDSNHPIFERIEEDIEFSGTLRNKLSTLSNGVDAKICFRPFNLGENISFEDSIYFFLNDIDSYMHFSITSHNMPSLNIPRLNLFIHLKDIALNKKTDANNNTYLDYGDDTKKRALRLISKKIKEMQENHFYVHKSYNKIKAKALK